MQGYSKPLTSTTANELIMLLCEAYYESFVNRFAVNDVIADFALIDPEGYDYHEIASLFCSFHDAGVTVLVSTHDTTLFAGRVQRRIVLAQGRLVGGGHPEHP